MAAVESVVGKLRHQREDVLGFLALDTALDRARHELLLVQRHLLALLLAHRATHQVSFAKSVARKFCASCMICS